MKRNVLFICSLNSIIYYELNCSSVTEIICGKLAVVGLFAKLPDIQEQKFKLQLNEAEFKIKKTSRWQKWGSSTVVCNNTGRLKWQMKQHWNNTHPDNSRALIQMTWAMRGCAVKTQIGPGKLELIISTSHCSGTVTLNCSSTVRCKCASLSPLFTCGNFMQWWTKLVLVFIWLIGFAGFYTHTHHCSEHSGRGNDFLLTSMAL